MRQSVSATMQTATPLVELRTQSMARALSWFEHLAAQTAGVECRKDAGVVDEIPGAYKDLQTVMDQQTDLVEIVHKLDTLVCVKG